MKGKVSFTIRDSKIDFSYLSSILNLEPTSIVNKGESVGKGSFKPAPFDIWRYQLELTNDSDIDGSLNKLITILKPSTKELKKLINAYDQVKVSCYLRSEYAQMGIELSPITITELAALGLGLEIHILSFGKIDAV